MKVLVAMSGGVDSSVAAAVLQRDGHDVVGVTMRLWGGASDTGCCSVGDVEDARRVAQQLGIDHLVFNFTDDFDAHVVGPYVDAHVSGTTPNPCIECNRRLKFARLAARAEVLGFDAVATGHHARIERRGGRLLLARGSDRAKDQSYVVHMLDQVALARTLFPVGRFADKADLRAVAAALGLRTASKPDSQDVCFITSTGGRREFLGRRVPFHPATVVDRAGATLGRVDAVELVTVGQRKGLGLPGGGPKRYVVEIDREQATVVVGGDDERRRHGLAVRAVTWVDQPVTGEVLVQCSAHGSASPATVAMSADGLDVRWHEPQRRVAPGQSVVLYDPSDTYVLGGGVAT
jgi:tRNA-specific 2-thiouridylase